MRVIEFRLAGTTFTEAYPLHINAMIARLVDGTGRPVRVTLERDPGNAHDENAIAVLHDGHRVGWVPKPVARAMAKLLDRGDVYDCEIEKVDHPAHPHNPGINVHCTRTRKVVLST